MRYDIYFHDDFDGRAAAAVMLAFLEGRGDSIEHYVPVKYDLIPQWIDEKFFEKHALFVGRRNPAIIVDFPYHPASAFWFDHHVRPFRKEGWEAAFATDKFHRFDETYRSACHLVYDSLKKDFDWKPPAHLKGLVAWLDVIDYANYRSPKQTIAMKEPALQINNFIEEHDDDAMTVWIIKALSRKSLADVARHPTVKRTVAKLRRDTAAALAFYEKNMKISGNVMVVDLTGFPYGGLGHYAPYYLHPEKRYAIRFHPFLGRPSLYHINVGANPWRRSENKKHIGGLLKTYGGGGHHDVGGVEIRGRRATLKAVDEFVSFLNKK